MAEANTEVAMDFRNPLTEGNASNSSTLKPFKCPRCWYSFNRREHLQRHIALHTGEKKFRCACGVAYSRKDVLSRHLKGCETGRNDPSLHLPKPNKRSRIKKACDRCARLKSKCNYQKPCNLCDKKHTPCEYTREDPNASLDVEFSTNITQWMSSASPDTSIDPSIDQWQSQHEHHVLPFVSSEQDSNQCSDFPTSASQELSPEMRQDLLDPRLRTENMHNNGFETFPTEFPTNNSGYTFEHIPIDLDLTNHCDSYVEGISLPMYWSAIPDTPQPILTPIDSADPPSSWTMRMASIQEGFDIEQIDPVEAKCNEIRDLLRGSEPLVTEEIIAKCITRENLTLFLQSYGKHYNRNFPILHSPTFNMAKTSPRLLLAMYIVGACYCEGIIPQSYMFKLAMRLLIDIKNQPHEPDMNIPSLSTIQSSLLVCPVLATSRDETAYKFVSVHFARNIDIARTAGLFQSTKSPDYASLTEETFDWEAWIEHELRTRLACVIFTHTIAGVIFEGNTPCISPLEFDVRLPCYEACWDAKSAQECLHYLQTTPRQPLLSESIRQIRLAPGATPIPPHLEISRFGMFTVMQGLHCLIWQAAHHDSSFTTPSGHTTSTQLSSLNSLLANNFSGHTVTALADAAIASYPSQSLHNMNDSLNVWMSLWNSHNRHKTSILENERKTFVHDSLPFWYLAKLYLLLHCARDMVEPHSEFANPRAKGEDMQGRFELMGKVIGWLKGFKKNGDGGDAMKRANDERCCVARIIDPVELAVVLGKY